MKTTTFDHHQKLNGSAPNLPGLPHRHFYSEELYLSDAHKAAMLDKTGTTTDSATFLDLEVSRWEKVVASGAPTLIADRSYLSTLAYAYARSKIAMDAGGDMSGYEAVAKECLARLPHFPPYRHMLILDCSVEDSLSRRTDFERVDPATANWVDRSFMTHFRSFYRSEEMNRFVPTGCNVRVLSVFPGHKVEDISDIIESMLHTR
jgi:thymidylate kinase